MDATSKMGRFGWATIGDVHHVPYIFRNDTEKFVPMKFIHAVGKNYGTELTLRVLVRFL
jgi:hypothetical protein